MKQVTEGAVPPNNSESVPRVKETMVTLSRLVSNNGQSADNVIKIKPHCSGSLA